MIKRPGMPPGLILKIRMRIIFANRWAAQTMTDNATPSAPQRSASDLLVFLKDHFAILSTLAIAEGTVVATVFLYGYLSVFDRHLFWVVQYPDILTFSLLAVAVVGASSAFIYNILLTVFSTGILSGKPNWNSVFVLIVVFVLLVAWQIYSEYTRQDAEYLHLL